MSVENRIPEGGGPDRPARHVGSRKRARAFPKGRQIESNALQVIDRTLDTNPYVAFGAFMHGCLTRISTEALVNVTAGGGSTVPTFLVEPR